MGNGEAVGEDTLEVAAANLFAGRINFDSAASKIRDTDVAEDSAEITRLSILQNAGASVLAQANLQPQLALQLLA